MDEGRVVLYPTAEIAGPAATEYTGPIAGCLFIADPLDPFTWVTL
jgi:hypothetical protein